MKDNLIKAQNNMKQAAYQNRSNKTIEVGETAYLKLQPCRQGLVVVRKNLKLTAKYYGPFKIVRKVGIAAYELKLPEGSSIHPVFHVSLLKK